MESLNSKFPLRPCPICDDNEREVLFRQRFESLAQVSLLRGYDVVACRKCGCTFADRIPAKKRFASYYADASKYEFAHRGGQQQQAELERLSGLAGWIARHCATDVRVLDAGCATGELLVRLKEQGFSNLTGLDPSPACVDYATKHHGLRMLQGVLGRKPADEALFDVVILSAVLEHIPDLPGLLQELQGWLKPRGSVVVEVPDAENFAKGVNAPYQEFSVEHVNFFSLASLGNLMTGQGFELVVSRQLICAAGPGVTGSVVTGIFQSGATPVAPTHEASSKKGIEEYLRSCEEWMLREWIVVADLVAQRTPVFVWGTGTLCQRLLATTELAEANITAFIDSNPHYQGGNLVGRPIIAPSELRQESRDPILITSWAFFDEISHSIRTDLKLSNPILTLHRRQ